jgi:hypothetical protein
MSANLFQQYLQPARSVMDYANDYARADLEREQTANARQTNALNAMTIEQKRAEQADAAETRNALQRVAATWNADTKPADRIASLRNTGRPALIAQADALEKADLEALKTRSEVGKRDVETLTATMGNYQRALDFIDTREGAARWLQAQYSDPVLGQYMQRLGTFEQAVQKLPTDPQAFQQWRQQAAMGMQKFVEQETQRRGQDMTDKRTREEGAANRSVQLRRQNLTDSRARETNSLTREANATVYDPERGVLINKATGLARPAATFDGKPIGTKDKPLNDTQAKALLFGTRMQEADQILGGLAGGGVDQPGLIKRSVESVPLIGEGLGSATNWTQSSGQQQVEQAQRDFINAVLRRESGAAIAQEEFDNARKQYFPQIGDSDAVKAQKAMNRQRATQLMLEEVPAARRASSAPTPAAPPSQAGPFTDAEKERRYQEWKRQQGAK